MRLIIAAGIALFAIVGYLMKGSINPITGQKQRVSLTVDQEIQMGLAARPEMVQQHGGMHPDAQAQRLVDDVGAALLRTPQLRDHPYQFEFHLLADAQTVNAFALPGGQVFITAALFNQFQTEGQLAGVLGHEIGHVIERHSAERIAKQELTQGLTGAAVIAADPGSRNTAAMAQMIGNLVNMKYGREDELESDDWGVKLMADAGYDPRAMKGVMEILAQAGGGGRQPEFFSTHPNPENRIERIEEAIQRVFPNGVPDGLKP